MFIIYRIFMSTKKILLFLFLLLFLQNCATAPSGQIQKTMIKDGSIKISMSMEMLFNTLGGSGATFPYWYKVDKKWKYVVFEPYTSQYGASYFDNNWYLGEQIFGKSSSYNNYKLIKIFDDPVDLHEYMIKILPPGKAQNQALAAKARILGNEYYQQWKSKSNKVVSNTKPKRKKKESNSTSQGSSGSAFFISSKGDIITNNHVIEDCRSQPKVKYNNKDVTANIVATDKMLDLALLKADLRNTKYISFSKDEPKKLQRIIVAGYPFGQYISDDLKFTSGIVSSLKGPGDDSTLVQVDAALNVGNSGGPIVDESSGQLVAVSVLTMDKSIAEGQNFGIKTSSVKNFLNANKVKVPFGFNFNRDVADSLEKSTLYVYCY